jgi:hypothetical protein
MSRCGIIKYAQRQSKALIPAKLPALAEQAYDEAVLINCHGQLFKNPLIKRNEKRRYEMLRTCGCMQRPIEQESFG